MSELKAISGHEIREDIDYNTRGIDPENKEWCKYGKELCDTLYYLKSEADKVIENRDVEIAKLKDSLGKLLKIETEQVMDEVLQKCLIYGEGFVPVEHAMRLVATTRHSSYKRCLAMASTCRLRSRWFCDNGFYKKEQWALQWHRRWLELAEKFKEAK